MKRLVPRVAVLVALCAQPSPVWAYAEIEVRSADDPGEGFNDPTPVAPVGGNTGTTLGEQRLIAVQYAADLWGTVLDSDVPIVVEATFDDIGCASGVTTLAYAGAASMEIGVERDGANPDWVYPAALADRLEGDDLRPGEPDISATFNDRPGQGCVPGTGWYYGLDARHGDDADLVHVALHELGHGLGFASYVDEATGELLGGFGSAFTAHLFDLDAELHYDEMDDAGRLSSLANARRVAWDGAQVSAEAPGVLETGTPQLGATPVVPGLTGLAGDANFGGPALAMSISAPLAVADDGCPLNDVAGRIALLRGGCAYDLWAAAVETSGAVGILLELPGEWVTPPTSLEQSAPVRVRIPVLSVSAADATLLATAAGTLTVHLSHAPGLRGADAQGRVLMNATDPATSSSLSHWDTLARPNLLMEPYETPHTEHEIDLTRALLVDIGWTPFCGNDRLDQEEACDDGADNSDSEADACRSDCTAARCGDGVADTGEACDEGEDNSDSARNACRSDCTAARCGDGVADTGEACDEGEDNSDSARNACRSDCTAARCGDGVADTGEACDEGEDNSDGAPDVCRSDCTAADCGDGVRDTGETCDQGAANSDSAPNACRRDCTAARCGDGVLDMGESCDDGAANSDDAPDACRRDCMPARCGDAVVDGSEMCDSPGACTPDCSAPLATGGPAADAGGAMPSEAGAEAADEGCGCRVPGRTARHTPASGWLLLCALAASAVRTRNRRRARST